MIEETNIDPQLQDAGANTLILPTRNVSDGGSGTEGEGNEATEKRRKLNLWKCKQCRDARKKCFPVDRTWPQKCNRCLQHRPTELPCSAPELNTRKRGPNLTKQTNGRSRPRTENAGQARAKTRSQSRSRTPTVSDRQEVPQVASDESTSSDETANYERPTRTMVPKGVKREHPSDTKPDVKAVPPVSDGSMHPAAVYPPMNKGEFRIMYLAPGRKEDKIVCSFVVTSKSEHVEYEAISYLWAADNAVDQKSVPIDLVDQKGYHHSIFLKSNVYNALRSLRHNKIAKAFWADALCINHSNGMEKNQQVRMKRYIFHNAANLCFWLGEDNDCKSALHFIPRILDLDKVDELIKDDNTIDEWVAFIKLLKNTIFGRFWIVQEVAVAKNVTARNVTLHCGQAAIHYEDFVDAVAILVSRRNDLSLLFRRMGKDYKALSDRKMAIAESFIDITTNALRVSKSGNSVNIQRLLSLEALVSQLSELNSSDPRDRIFAILALARDGPSLDKETLETLPDGELQIDYGKSVLEIYQKFVVHAVKRSRSLDIICRQWAPSVPMEDFPTWVRPLRSPLQKAVDYNTTERTSPDSLVGLPDRHYYNASRGTLAPQEPLIEPLTPSGKKSFSTWGFQADTISKLGPRSSEGIIFGEWLELGGCHTAIGDGAAPEDFWRVLVADRGPNGTNVPCWYNRAFLYCLNQLTPNGDINTNRLIEECEAGSSLVVEFLKRVQSVIWNRKFLVSKKNGWIGLAPMAAEVGDVVVILEGCSVPVVLRQEVWGLDISYLLVGECYVHGLMDGEIIEAGEAKYKRDIFKLK